MSDFDPEHREAEKAEAGSGLVLAIFVIALLTGMGVVLLSATQMESRTNKVSHQSKKSLYLAEAGLEQGRQTLRLNNVASNNISLNAELATAAGANGTIDFNPATVTPTYDSSGNITGFTGFGDDAPLQALTTLGGGKYEAFVTNDATDGRSAAADTNSRVSITGVGAGPDRSFEVVEAVVDASGPFPAFPATITILGSSPDFSGGNSNAKTLSGNDCNGAGVPGLSVPVVGAIGAPAVTDAQAGVNQPGTYVSGTNTGTATVGNVQSTIDPSWLNCQDLLSLASFTKSHADVVGTSATSSSLLGTPGNSKIVYIEGNYTISGSFLGAGLLWVTGTLTFSGNPSWSGIILVVGDGTFNRSGGGNSNISGAALVANISGADGNMWTADDCAGPDGITGNSDDGIAPGGTWDVSGGGAGTVDYCTNSIASALIDLPLKELAFRQY